MGSKLRQFFIGMPINPFNAAIRRNLTLIALFAWVGLGADAISSACYGPEEAYLALGPNSDLAVFVAAITIVTIFIISLGYNQLIELFPSGGGGYKVATKLLHPYVGLIAGCALLVDYVLTITVSIASGVDAFFSLLPPLFLPYKLHTEIIFIGLLLVLNLRGMKETIQVLLPIFLGFMFVHAGIIFYGIFAHIDALHVLVPNVMQNTRQLAFSMGWISVIGLTLHAYSLGSGTYTGLESVSNNIQNLAEPRVITGKRTMMYMAASLSFMAGGIMLLYLLWSAQPVPGQTLNAVVFHSILGDGAFGKFILFIALPLEAALLLVAANTGFMAGPIVLANMAVDSWVPNRFRNLSDRLVIQNGILFFGIFAVVLLVGTRGHVATLVVLYSINVFITFSLSLLGICVYWLRHRNERWVKHFVVSSIACLLTTSILLITLYYKFSSGGWLTLLITSSIILLCLRIKHHYKYVKRRLQLLEPKLAPPLKDEALKVLAIDPKASTALIFVNNLSVGMHTLLFIFKMFPDQFKNFVFLSVGAVDIESYQGQGELNAMQVEVNKQLDYFIQFCRQQGFPAEGYAKYGTDMMAELKDLTTNIALKYPHSIYFASQLIFSYDNMLTRLLHNQTSFMLQDYLHNLGREMIIVPMRI